MKKTLKTIGLILLVIYCYDLYSTLVLYIQLPKGMPDELFMILAGIPIFGVGYALYNTGK